MTIARLLRHAAAVAAGTVLAAQQPAGTPLRYTVEAAREDGRHGDDYREERLFGGFRFRVPDLDLEIRGGNALVLLDAETVHALSEREAGSGLPRATVGPPAPRRRLTADELRTRLERTLRALGPDAPQPAAAAADRDLQLVRYVYCEGGITVVRGGIEVIRCDRLWISPLDDRVVVENAELR
ncbi:MAG: hypothetical protein FJ265_22930 [Planctomycetes bacterium]|nr:hypothetical protein [Planctomycetota bacterium]